MVSAGKEGAISGGPAFMKAIGDDLIDGIVGDNIPIFTGESTRRVSSPSSLVQHRKHPWINCRAHALLATAEEEKYNEAVNSSINRIVAVLEVSPCKRSAG